MKKFTVIRDTKEHKGFGWSWETSNLCEGTVSQSLKTGDYSLVGFENIFSVERKRNTGEIAGNFFDKNFDEELERASHLQHFWVVLEFSFEDILTFPAQSGIPHCKWRYLRVTGPALLKRLIELQMKYPTVHFLFAGKHGKDVASSIFKRMVEEYAK